MASRVIAWAEPLVVIAITPLLLFPAFRPTWSAVALALLALVWVLRAFVRRELWPVTPLNLALLLFCLSIPVAVWASAVPELTLPKLTALILGLATLRVLPFVTQTERGRLAALAVFGLVGLGFWALGIVGSGISFFQPIVQRLPAWVMEAVGGPDRAVNPNVLAGALVPYVPMAAALAAFCWSIRRKGTAVVLALVGLFAIVTLVWARSRSAVAGAAASLGLLALMIAWFRASTRVRRSLALGFALVLIAGLLGGAVLVRNTAGPGSLTAQQPEVMNKELSLASRVELWSRALYAIEDFPFTGVGLGAFPRVLQVLYPVFLSQPEPNTAHPHNVFLQAGVDFGLPGLVGYIALLLAAAATAWQVASMQRGFAHYLALGLLAALVGLHIHGLTNSLDAKPWILLWLVLGMIAGLPPAHEVQGEKSPGSERVAIAPTVEL